jgi:hypothetical protein
MPDMPRHTLSDRQLTNTNIRNIHVFVLKKKEKTSHLDHRSRHPSQKWEVRKPRTWPARQGCPRTSVRTHVSFWPFVLQSLAEEMETRRRHDTAARCGPADAVRRDSDAWPGGWCPLAFFDCLTLRLQAVASELTH